MYFYQEPELEPAPDKKFPEPPQNRPAQKPCSALTQIVPYLSSLYTVFHSVIFNSVVASRWGQRVHCTAIPNSPSEPFNTLPSCISIP